MLSGITCRKNGRVDIQIQSLHMQDRNTGREETEVSRLTGRVGTQVQVEEGQVQ